MVVLYFLAFSNINLEAFFVAVQVLLLFCLVLVLGATFKAISGRRQSTKLKDRG